MPSKLEQVMALAPQRNAANGFELDPLPELLNPSPDAIRQFNEGMKEWRRKTEIRISERLARQDTES